MDNNVETYLTWKSDLAKARKTTADMVKLFHDMGMMEYANQLNSFILEMEALSEAPV